MTTKHDCQQCLELLPWYANGSLPAPQTQQVTQHLAQCTSCEEQLQFMLRLQQQVREHDIATPEPDWRALQPRLDVPVPQGRRWMKWGLMPAAAMIVVAAIITVRTPVPTTQSHAYKLMTSSQATTLPQGVATLRVLPAEGNDRAGIDKLFAGFGAEIVSGPTPRGVYTVAVREPVADRAAFIASLRANHQIEFAEWVDAP